MVAKKCDRCGTYYDEYHKLINSNKVNSIRLINRGVGVDSTFKIYDLCPKCMDKFLAWFDMEEKTK